MLRPVSIVLGTCPSPVTRGARSLPSAPAALTYTWMTQETMDVAWGSEFIRIRFVVISVGGKTE